jgi:L-threonylcarbamoyladenylate synthase
VITDPSAAARVLRAGGLVAMPTETVYGLAADAENRDAVLRVFAVKGRPREHPLIVHLASSELLTGWVDDIPDSAAVLAAACWPGPLTLLLRRGRRVLDEVTGGRDTVAIRVPAHPLVTAMLERFGGGAVAPSANTFGRVSPTSAAHVLADLAGFLDPERDVILDGGESTIGVESTIVDCTTDRAQLLRPGGIPAEDIEALIGDLDTTPAPAGPARASGMLASHYAPRARVELVDDHAAGERRVDQLIADGVDAVLLDAPDLVTYARTLYASLRAADDQGRAVVVAVRPPADGLGHAIRDRLTKAATPSS